MFYDLYDKIEKKLDKAEIDSVSDMKYYCDEMVKAFFKNIFPEYESYVGSVDGLIRIISEKLAKRFDEKVELVYKEIVKELDLLVPNWENFIDINNLSNKLSDIFVDMYYKKKNTKKKKNANVESFNDAITSTINRNVSLGVVIDSKEDMEKFLTKLFNEYFDKHNKYAFTSMDGARKYVESKNKRELLTEMIETANLETSSDVIDLEDEIRNEYIKEVVENLDIN